MCGRSPKSGWCSPGRGRRCSERHSAAQRKSTGTDAVKGTVQCSALKKGAGADTGASEKSTM